MTPAVAELPFEDVELDTSDGERLHAWWIPSRGPSRGHVLLFHGNAGNIGDRIVHAAMLTAVGLDVFLFDYRGYGRSSGRPDEAGTYLDARAARRALAARADVDPARVLYLGESLGGAVALELAVADAPPPAGMVLQSAFTSVRDIAREHYPFIPGVAIPDAYPSLRRIAKLRAPLLVVHGSADEIVPVGCGQALFDAAPEPKCLHLFRGAGHNDLFEVAGQEYAQVLSGWLDGLLS